MKRILAIALALWVAGFTADAQNILGRLGERAKQAVENNLGNKVEKGVNDILDGKKKNKEKGKEQAEVEEAVEEAGAATDEKVDFEQIQAKSDFVRGANVFFSDDLKGEKLGEFPSKWDLLNGSECEVVNTTATLSASQSRADGHDTDTRHATTSAWKESCTP